MVKIEELKQQLLAWPDLHPPTSKELLVRCPDLKQEPIIKEDEIKNSMTWFDLTREQAELLFKQRYDLDYIFNNKINNG